TLMALFAFSGATLAHAQTSDEVKAKIPFDFYVGSHKMPAGTYLVNVNTLNQEVDLSSADNAEHIAALGVLSGDETRPAPRLDFDQVGNDYFLKDIATPEATMDLSVSKAEQQIAGVNAPTGTTVTASLEH